MWRCVFLGKHSGDSSHRALNNFSFSEYLSSDFHRNKFLNFFMENNMAKFREFIMTKIWGQKFWKTKIGLKFNEKYLLKFCPYMFFFFFIFEKNDVVFSLYRHIIAVRIDIFTDFFFSEATIKTGFFFFFNFWTLCMTIRRCRDHV
jgi:hypothetical protein